MLTYCPCGTIPAERPSIGISMRKILPAVLWLIFIYVLTALADTVEHPPTEFWARVAFEVEHLLAHSSVYAIETWLILRTVGIPNDRRTLLILLALMVVFGVGQETMQAILRAKLELLGSVWDLFTDGVGAIIAVRLYRGWQSRRALMPISSHPGADVIPTHRS